MTIHVYLGERERFLSRARVVENFAPFNVPRAVTETTATCFMCSSVDSGWRHCMPNCESSRVLTENIWSVARAAGLLTPFCLL